MATSPLLGTVDLDQPTRTSVHPVEIEIRAEHTYKNRGKGKNGCGFVLPDGSACMKAMTDRSHLGLPLSLNMIGSRGGHHTYNSFKGKWEEALTAALNVTSLPAGWRAGAAPSTPKIELISVEALLCFPKSSRARDQGNFRWFLEKCLGDALEAGGWIEDDSIWPVRHFDFGGLEIEHRPGEAWTRMILFPTVI